MPTAPPPADTTISLRSLASAGGDATLGDDEARVVDRRDEFGGQRKCLVQPGEAPVAVHQHRVDPAVGEVEHFALALRFPAQLKDVPQRRDHDGPRARRRDAFQQRDELEGERPAPERKRLEHHERRPGSLERGEQLVAPTRPIGVVDGVAVGIAQYREIAVGDAQRRQLHDAHAGRHALAYGHSSAHEVNVDSHAGKGPGHEARAHQVADAHQMLHMDQDGWH